jgi:transcription termination factor Rho
MRLRKVVRKSFALRKSDRSELSTPAIHRAILRPIDIFLSGTRREELLLEPWELEKINLIRRGLAGRKPVEAIQRLLMFVKKFPTNKQMLKEIPG